MHKRRMDREGYKAKYESWWKGKLCRLKYSQARFKRVVEVKVFGPPSFVYGDAQLVYEDGTEQVIANGLFRPRKMDVEVKDESKQ